MRQNFLFLHQSESVEFTTVFACNDFVFFFNRWLVGVAYVTHASILRMIMITNVSAAVVQWIEVHSGWGFTWDRLRPSQESLLKVRLYGYSITRSNIESYYLSPYISLISVMRICCYIETISVSWWFSLFLSTVCLVMYYTVQAEN